MVIMGSL